MMQWFNESVTQSRNRSMFWRLWLRSISVKRPQAALALGSLLLGAAITSMLLNLYGDVRRKMNQEFRAYGPNVVVGPRAALSNAGSGVGARTRPTATENLAEAEVVDQNLMSRLDSFRAERPGFTAVPVLYVITRVHRVASDPRLPKTQNVVTVGADFADLQRLYSGWRVQLAGGALKDGTCVIGTRLASRLRLNLGDAVEIEAESGEAQARNQAYRVAGLLATGTSEDDQAFIPLPALERLAGLEGKLSLVQLSIPGETREIERTVRELSKTFPDLEVSPIRQIVYSEGHVLGMIRGLLFLLTALILVIMSLCVMATMTAIVLERRKDVAVMKALGASDRLVTQLFLAEGASLGLAGGVAGFILGAVLADYLARRLFGVALNLVGWTFPVICLLMVLLAVVATIFPVRLVRTVQPATVLKGE